VIALEGWLALCPADPDALVRLAMTLENMGDIEGAVEACARLADALDDVRSAEVLERAAQLAEQKLGDRAKAADLLVRALQFDPDRAGLVETTERVLSAEKAWARLADVYEQAAQRSRDTARKLALTSWLGLLARDRLHDPAMAARAFAAAVSLDPKNPDLRCLLAGARAEAGDHEGALDACRAIARLSPRDPRPYRIAHGSFVALRRTDGAFATALCLDVLGEANVDESMLVETHRPEGLLAARDVLTSDDWHASLLFPERDPAMTSALDLLTAPSLQGKLEILKRGGKAIAFDPGQRQDLPTSTATMFRALLWATRILAIPTPHVYLQSHVPGHIVAVPTSEPSVVAGRGIASGLDLKQLVFLWGRGLCVFRPEQYVAAFFPTPDDLNVLLAVAAAVVQGKSPAVTQPDARALATAVDRALSPQAKSDLGRALASLRSPARAAEDWLVSYELSCCRAGLLACGDLGQAVALTETLDFGTLTTPPEQIDDLFRFSLTDEFAALRRRLGVNV
jgi:tetratricopeptide (TPR) repeat protein